MFDDIGMGEAVELAGRFNVWYAIKYLVYFIWHLALASWQVAWLAVRPGA
ncbi:MAG TPA: Na+/H+ antiporter subunit E [Spirochaetales bacterium]|nr:Na+/H+ antiporter subunit E [Spirochaetales bacterium]